MTSIANAANTFLGQSRIAVTGVSRNGKGQAANTVYRRLRERGYQVFPVNPNAEEVEGDHCYPDLRSIPSGVEAVVIGTAPARALSTMEECVEFGINHVWFHRGPGIGSFDPAAAKYGRDNGVSVITGGCPCMFGNTADTVHKIMRPILQLTGNVPRQV